MNASSSLAKRAAAVAASGWTKLLVRKSASEFSPHALGGRPSRTARVSRREALRQGLARDLALGSSGRLGGALQRERDAVAGAVVLVAGAPARGRHRGESSALKSPVM